VPDFRERLWPPLLWWVLTAAAVATLAMILSSAVPLSAAVVVGVLLAGGAAAGLARYAATVTVDEHGLAAGPAVLPWSAIGSVVVLDASAAAHQRGPGADHRAYLLLRAYAPMAVRVEVHDDADPTPYWYVSTRRPAELGRALAARGRIGER
jgi:hypothetical protein